MPGIQTSMTWRRQAIAHGRNGLILEANLTAVIMLGMAKGALISMSIHQFLNEDRDIFYLHRFNI